MTVRAPFARGWVGPDLPGYRFLDATYGVHEDASLPPLDLALDGGFAWLTQMDHAVAQAMESCWQDEAERSRLDTHFERIVAEAVDRDYVLPKQFLDFMRSSELRRRVPSCTACYFDAPERIVEAPPPGDGILIRFMNDQQWCFLWYLYIEPNGAHAVVVSDQPLDVEDLEGGRAPQLRLCATSFEEFLARTWIENCAWFVLVKKHRDLSPRERSYLGHYRR